MTRLLRIYLPCRVESLGYGRTTYHNGKNRIDEYQVEDLGRDLFDLSKLLTVYLS